MKPKKYLSVLIISIMILAACEKEVTDIDPPEVDEMLVVSSFISPSDSFIVVKVTKSVPYFGKNSNDSYDKISKGVDDAVVIMSSEGKSIQFTFDPEREEFYASAGDFPIVRGNTYNLAVAAPGGFFCSAKTTVPASSPANLTVTLDSTIKESEGGQLIRYKVVSNWNDVAGMSNYYRITSSFSYGFGPGVESEDGFCDQLVRDIDKDGQLISRNCFIETYYYGYGYEPVFGFEDSAYLLTVDEEYYKYHETLYRYSGDDPFSEPLQIYTNVEGGLGCFGSYLRLSAPLRK